VFQASIYASTTSSRLRCSTLIFRLHYRFPHQPSDIMIVLL
jgi:hypothetical protein